MIDHAADRMNQNAAALVASSLVTSLLGLLFWVLAAKVLPTAEVGTGTAVITSIVLLGNLATLGMRNGLIRFIAPAGPRAARFVAGTYALCATVAVVIAAGFAFGTPWWAHELQDLRHHLPTGIAFAAGCAVWTIFVLQDNVLTGLRRAVWVPLENVCYSVAKLGLLAALVATGAWALPLAWCVPALAAIVPINVLIFRRLLPENGSRPTEAIFSRAAIARFSIGDFGADMIRMLGVEVVVLVVLGMRGADDTAYVFFAITIAASGQLLANNVVTAFVAEASARPHAAADLARRAARNIGALLVPGAAAGALLAPVVLAAVGTEYADNGTALLRLLIIDSVPMAVVALAVGWARFERAVATMVAISLGGAVAPLFGAVVLAPTFGLEAIGWAALFGHTVLAGVLLATTLRAVYVGDGGPGLLGWLVERRAALRQRRRARTVAAVLDELDATGRGPHDLEPRWLVPSDNDTAIVRVDDMAAPLVVKIALSAEAAGGLRRHVAALRELHAIVDGLDGVPAIPTVVEVDECAGHLVVIETACPGRRPLAADHATLTAVAGAVAAIHELTATRIEIDDAAIERLVTAPIEVLAGDRRLWSAVAQTNALWSLLNHALVGRRLVVARTHGDCWTGNALVDAGPGGVRVTGLVDWEDSSPAGLPDADLAHLWLAAQGRHIGRTVAGLLRAGAPIPVYADLGVRPPNDDLPAEVAVLLAWLGHVAAGLGRAGRFGLGRSWIANNVRPVLAAVEELDAAGWADRRIGSAPMIGDAR